jgi:hypothetical protein
VFRVREVSRSTALGHIIEVTVHSLSAPLMRWYDICVCGKEVLYLTVNRQYFVISVLSEVCTRIPPSLASIQGYSRR